MKKNVAGQAIGAQMVSAADGSAFTGAVTVYVTGDAGTQAVGSVGSGACTHEGNGYHTYAPAQAETNYDLIAFTFIGSGAIPATIQVFTTYPQTGDSYARLGAPVGASVSADIATVDGNVDSILDDTGTSGVIVATNSDKTGYSISGTKTTLDALNDIDGTSVTATTVSDKTGYALSAAGVQAIWDALTSALTTVGSIGKKLADWVLGTDSKALVSTDAQDLSGTLDVNAKTVGDKTGYSISGTKTTLDALNDVSAAEVNAEMVDAVNVDTYAEPGQGAPPATATLVQKIGYLYKMWRNKKMQDATTFELYDDAGTTVDQKATVSDNGTDYTHGEIGSGP